MLRQRYLRDLRDLRDLRESCGLQTCVLRVRRRLVSPPLQTKDPCLPRLDSRSPDVYYHPVVHLIFWRGKA